MDLTCHLSLLKPCCSSAGTIARSQELSVGLPHGLQESRYLIHHYCLPECTLRRSQIHKFSMSSNPRTLIRGKAIATGILTSRQSIGSILCLTFKNLFIVFTDKWRASDGSKTHTHIKKYHLLVYSLDFHNREGWSRPNSRG